ncbi:hypothetical protein CDD80_2535 [Ophiocordyceps camponoti-rufipedis]|uniref:DNA-binding protein RAP1 n=1 Tax=Ophiocordyceps camponoti-rufipedis TaxID=2004952 RepID=A0A2C5Z046_9HYPO|nr:hypothetical protein CDD80_2535 [Ophiocordyceps camponoti-rufipedis]
MSQAADHDVASAQAGNMFQGKRFWVARTVPARPSVVVNITRNGGIVAALEKDADLLIANPAKKDAPAGSYSWELIADSVKHGIMQPEDRYYIAGTQAKAAKYGRIAFTHEDDINLSRWVIKHKKGFQGNNIYKDLECQNPRHPWQSWKSHFTSKLHFKGWDYITKLAAEKLPGEEDEIAESSARPDAAVAPSTSPARENDVASEMQTDEEAESSRDHLYRLVGIYCDEMGIQNDHVHEHVIGGKHLDLWELKNAVCQQEAPTEQVDWQRVAKDLCPEWEGDAQICADLQECFEKNLAPVLRLMSAYKSRKDGNNVDGEGSQPSPDRSSVPATMPSSPPGQTPRRKRQREAEPDSPSPGVKRPRRHDGQVSIPSTPESRIGLVRRSPPATGVSSAQTERPPVVGERDSPSPSQQLLSEEAQLQHRGSHSDPVRRQTNRAGSEEAPRTSPRRRSTRNVSESTATPRETAKSVRRSLPSTFGSPANKGSPLSQRRQKHQARSTAGSGSRSSGTEALSSEEANLLDRVQDYVSLGYPERIVIEALKSTSMRPGGAAAHAMQSLKEGKGIPTNVEGAWTAKDDGHLVRADEVMARGADAGAAESKRAEERLRRLEHKHGAESLELRRRYLGDLAVAMGG